MKVMITYPPFPDIKGTPLLSQNRQYQVFSEKSVIYPVVPATAATLLKENGFEVVWLDCIAEGISQEEFYKTVKKEAPDLIAMEVKTPVVKQEWKIVDELKAQNPKLKTVLFGDHVTALPRESFESSKVDYVLTGGDYDFLLLNLSQVLKKISLQPACPVDAKRLYGEACGLQPDLEPGIWYRENNEAKNTGKFELNHDLDSLPFIDRDLTKWKLYAYKNGNYRRTPGTYIMSARDCWWAKCSFCSWTTTYPQFRARKPENVLDEVEHLVNKYKVKEIMDDSGTLPAGEWLKEFCEGMIKRGLNKKVNLDCNMRFGALSLDDYKLMRKAGFRFLLFGLESANQKTLDRINKGLKVDMIIQSCKDARAAGLYPHITLMFGYPWESCQDAKKTLELGKRLLKKDYAYTMQATMVIPYPGTPLFKECKEKDLLYTLNWEDYDMKSPVMKLNFEPEKLMKLVQSMYSVSFNPEFILRKILSIRDVDDIKYFSRGFLKVLGHIFDFRKNT